MIVVAPNKEGTKDKIIPIVNKPTSSHSHGRGQPVDIKPMQYKIDHEMKRKNKVRPINANNFFIFCK